MKRILKYLNKWLGQCFLYFVSRSSPPKCDCGEACIVERPATTIITLGRFEAHILNHKKDIYSKYCLDCFLDVQNEPMREVAQAAFNDGYNKCYDDHC